MYSSMYSGGTKAADRHVIVWCLTKLYQITIGSCFRSCRAPVRFCQRYLFCQSIPNDESDHELSDIASDEEAIPFLDENYWERNSLVEKAGAKLKLRVRHHFHNHIYKWINYKHPTFPWKLVLHLLLVGLVTAQVWIFAADKDKVLSFLNQNKNSFEKYFIRKECTGYVSKLYTMDDVYQQIEHAVDSYYNISQQGVNSFKVVENRSNTALIMKVRYISDNNHCDGDNCVHVPLVSCGGSNEFDPNLDEPCCNVNASTNTEQCSCTIKERVECFVNGSNIQKVTNITFDFILFASYGKHAIEDYNPVDLTFHIIITLENKQFNNLILDVEATAIKLCRKDNKFWYRRKTTLVDVAVLVIMLMSFWTYIRSIFKTGMLAKDLKLHFLAYHEKHLRWKEISPLYNKWYILMLFTNLLIFVATVVKIYCDYFPEIYVELLEAIGVLLGIGILLLWCGLFGILKYFEPLNVILITVELAVPSILRFAIYICILFIAFSLCGWLMLGSYHSKFEGPLVTAVSLFCILNGDDLYETFNKLEVQSDAVKIFGKIYLCVVMFLFIYIVLGLFIGIFNHAYESLSKNWKRRSLGFLRDWAEGEPEIDPTKNYPFPIPRVRKTPAHPTIDPRINNSGDSSITGSVDSIHEIANDNIAIPVIHVTNPADDPVNLSIHSIGEHGRSLSDSNLLAPQSDVHRDWYGNSLDPSSAHANAPIHRHRHTFHGHSGPQMIVCQQHSAKALVADPPRANKKEIARARSKLWTSNPNLHHGMEDSST